MEMSRRAVLPTLMAFAAGFIFRSARAADPAAIEIDLALTIDGVEKRVGVGEALRLLKVPSASIALIDRGEIAFARAYGEGAGNDLQDRFALQVRGCGWRHASR
jgi:CubicO group peptidase (beta-lactamase class C family)